MSRINWQKLKKRPGRTKLLSAGSSRNRRLLLVGSLVLAGLLLCFTLAWLWGEIPYWRQKPEETIAHSLALVQMGRSYAYTMEAVEEVNGQRRVLAVLEGVKSGDDAHITGELPFINGSIALIRKSGQLYRKDALDGRWVKVPLVSMEDLEDMMVEINPLSIFQFLSDTEGEYKGKEKVDGRRCRVYEAASRGENMWLTFYWQDYNYRIWVDQKEGQLRRGEIVAEHRDDATHRLITTVTIRNFNEQVIIEGPPGDPEVFSGN